MKKVLIIYDTMFGNTRKLALELATGIQQNDEIITKVANGDGLETEDLSKFDGVLFGGPTRAFRATRGAMNSIKRAGEIGLDGKVVSTFGTYMVGKESRGVRGMDKKLRKVARDAKVISPGFSVKVEGPRGPIEAEEIPKAHEWGRSFGLEVLQNTPQIATHPA
ncbi:MAG: flavodoxin domain-containing protein [Candidatus Thorarchaeota archaeon]|jgi:flavodoxin